MTDAHNTETPDADAAPRCYRHPDRATYISCQRCGRPICTQCQTQAAVGVQCPECLREGRDQVAPRTPGWVNALRPRGNSVVTYTLIGLNVVIYALQWITGQGLTAAWYLFPYLIGSEPWRLITSAFLHSTSIILVHLLVNMYALYLFGPLLESFLGRARFIALYLIGALGGSLGVLTAVEVWIFTDGNPLTAPVGSLGASGAIFALLGAVFAMRKALGVDVRQLFALLVINLAIPFFIGGIAWEAHVGGLIIGFLIGLVLVSTRRRQDLTKQIAGIAGIAVGLLVLFGAYLVSAPAIYF
ncbi:MAG: rhomboid family intramembrane serine protease [Pseudolysinimonas sp.]